MGSLWVAEGMSCPDDTPANGQKMSKPKQIRKMGAVDELDREVVEVVEVRPAVALDRRRACLLTLAVPQKNPL